MSYIEGTCELPYPPPAPLAPEVRRAHCYFPRKCWWYEGGTCYNPHPDNARYPHRTGHRHIPLDEQPEQLICAETIAQCKAGKWRAWDPRGSALAAELSIACNGEEWGDIIGADRVGDCNDWLETDDDDE